MTERKTIIFSLKNIHRIFVISMIPIFLAGCIKDDVTDVVTNSHFTPVYSLPVGVHEFELESAFSEYASTFGFDFVFDTINIPDSSNIFVFDNIYFQNPINLDFWLEDAFNISTLSEQLDNITSLMLRINYVNRIPGKVYLQVYFFNAAYATIDSTFHSGLLELEPALIDNEGNVIPVSDQKDEYLSQQTIDLLPAINFALIYVRFETENYMTTNIRYFGNQTFWVQMGIRAGLDIPLNEN